MLKLIAAATVAAFLAAPAFAADNPQQSKMATCNKDAGEKKGDERKAFMSQCLKAKKESTAPAACEKSADEKKLAGAARTSHVKKCTTDMAAKKP